MSDEKRMILNMLKEGKITEDEALKLLEAIGEQEAREGTGKGNDYDHFEANVIDKITRSVDKIVKKTGEAINNIDFDEIAGYFSGNARFKGRLEKSYTKSISDMEECHIHISNSNGKINFQNWNNDFIQVDTKIQYDDSLVTADYEFLSIEKEEDTIHITTGRNGATHSYAFDINMTVYLPNRPYDSVKVEASNGALSGIGVEADEISLETSNGKIYTNALNASEISLKGKNAAIEAMESEGKNLKIKTTNGKIFIHGIYLENVEADTTNGSIILSDITELTKTINIQTVNGAIRIGLSNYARSVKVFLHGLNKYSSKVNLSERFGSVIRNKGEVTAYTDGFTESDEDGLYIEGSTQNGTVNID